MLPVEVEIIGALPHCHLICDAVKGWVTLPDGSQKQLIEIEQWNFYNQQEVQFEQPIKLPQGTTLSIEFSYDNSGSNTNNPNSPPLDIEFGPLSANEMADFWIQVSPGNKENSLDSHVAPLATYVLD